MLESNLAAEHLAGADPARGVNWNLAWYFGTGLFHLTASTSSESKCSYKSVRGFKATRVANKNSGIKRPSAISSP